jgi:hypothetical protein
MAVVSTLVYFVPLASASRDVPIESTHQAPVLVCAATAQLDPVTGVPAVAAQRAEDVIAASSIPKPPAAVSKRVPVALAPTGQMRFAPTAPAVHPPPAPVYKYDCARMLANCDWILASEPLLRALESAARTTDAKISRNLIIL